MLQMLAAFSWKTRPLLYGHLGRHGLKSSTRQRDPNKQWCTGYPYGHGKDYVDIKFTVPFQYKPLVLKCNFKIAVNNNCSTNMRVTL